MSDIIFEYTLIGCKEGCIYRLPNTEETKTNYDPRRHIHYTVLEITPHCARVAECAARRAEIYQRAQDASDAAFERYNTIRTKCRGSQMAWREIADEYTTKPCPFFVPASSA